MTIKNLTPQFVESFRRSWSPVSCTWQWISQLQLTCAPVVAATK